MEEYKPKTKRLINETSSKLDIREVTEDNIGIINNYIFNNLLLPLEKKKKKRFSDKKSIHFYQSVIKEIKSKESYKECLANCLIRKSTNDFISSRILPEMNIKELTNENYSDVCDYISDKYEVPLIQQEEEESVLSPEENVLLNLATDAVTDLTSDIKVK
jgi:hypothetical protein